MVKTRQLNYKFVTGHIAYHDQQASIRLITIEQANDFLDRFTHQKPSDELLNELQAISVLSDENKEHPRRQATLEYCLDIASACTKKYPYDMHERIVHEEKRLLKKLFKELDIQSESKQ